MGGTLDTLVAVALIAGLGYVSVWRGLFEGAQVDGVRRLVLYFCLPALIVGAFADMEIAQVFRPGYVLVYASASLLTFLIVLITMLAVRKAPLTRAAFAAIGSAVSNAGFIGYPIASVVLGPEVAIIALALNFAIENMVVTPLGLLLAEAGGQRGVAVRAALVRIAAGLARNPLIIAIVLGVLVALSGVAVPGPVTLALDVVAGAAAPAALFVVGATLATTRAGDLTLETGLVTLGKLVLHPALTVLALALYGYEEPGLAAAAVLFASMPMMAIYPLLARPFGLDRPASAAMLVATVLGFFTVYGVVVML